MSVEVLVRLCLSVLYVACRKEARRERDLRPAPEPKKFEEPPSPVSDRANALSGCDPMIPAPCAFTPGFHCSTIL